ncbi:hypothetical protein pwc_10 [Weissella phage PWc]|nr:hypothetical protein pwc_10 [Weissella phage PWc]
MKYTQAEKDEAIDLLKSNHTIGGMMKALTLSGKYPNLIEKIYNSTTNRETVKTNELAFIDDYLQGNFELSNEGTRYVVKLTDDDNDVYYLFKGNYGDYTSMYTSTLDTFSHGDGLYRRKAEEIAYILGGTIVPI